MFAFNFNSRKLLTLNFLLEYISSRQQLPRERSFDNISKKDFVLEFFAISNILKPVNIEENYELEF
jgi:hypothetical protein